SAPYISILPWLPSVPSRKLSVPAQGVPGGEPLPRLPDGQQWLAGHPQDLPSMSPNTSGSQTQAHCESGPSSQAKLDLEQLVAVVEDLPVQLSSSEGKQLVQVVQDMEDWDRLEESSRDQLTQALLRCLRMGRVTDNSYQLSIAPWTLVRLKHHLPPPAATSAFSAFISHCASSKAMKWGSWCDWGRLLHALGATGMRCSNCPELSRLCDQAVQFLPGKLHQGLANKYITRPTKAMVSVGYRGSAQPLMQAITAAINQGTIMVDAGFPHWRKLIKAAAELPDCRSETRQLLAQFAAKASGSMDDMIPQDASTLLYAMRLVQWPDVDLCRQLAKQVRTDRGQLASSLCSLVCLGYLDSSMRNLAAKVAEADLTAFGARDLTNLLHAWTMFLALSIHRAVSSGHSQLASEPQLNSMAAALWRECSRREEVGEQWSEQGSQWLGASSVGQISLAETPSFLRLVTKAVNRQSSSTESAPTTDGCVDYSQLVQALAAAGDNEVEQAALSLDVTYCAQLVVKGPGLTRGIAVYQSHEFLPDGSMSGAVAHVKLQQLVHFDAGVVGWWHSSRVACWQLVVDTVVAKLWLRVCADADHDEPGTGRSCR
ncbi:hypothetical protein HaLaN_28307, partial [Haematococcus lacustris]